MRKVARKPAVPRKAEETVRHAVIALLGEGALSARDISMAVRIAEKEVYAHLEHIRRSIHAAGSVLEVTPAECRDCGFVFAKRERLTPPGRCPVCRSETILEPLYGIKRQQGHETG
ncbi:MAG: transcriptional regulator [Deltaproteobacteria bacterium]|nr:transcriptional regulator [Deltaproteobacteria bacterium]